MQYGNFLTPFEFQELESYKNVYTIGQKRIHDPRNQKDKVGFYKLHQNEQIAYRYWVQKVIDAGAFGSVARCKDMKTNEIVAIKISKQNEQDIRSSKNEAQHLDRVK